MRRSFVSNAGRQSGRARVSRFRLLASTFCFVLAITGCSGDASTVEPPAPVPIAIGSVRHVKTLPRVPVSGTVVSPYEPTRIAFLVAGKVRDALFREGAYVQKGELMADLDPSDYRFAVEGAAAAVRQAR
ncbi:biotin/lipoyl-binding protein, partial [Desulfosarcina cetonica]|uniref:biotin/lipoyl-binding protein n=1 Tax=Desulfosarcina cetonica TaxID=90730 RepID=UPI00155D938B